MEKVRKFVNDCEKELRRLKNSKTEINQLSQMSKKLIEIESELKNQAEEQEAKVLLKDIDELLFIINSMIDYYNEEMSEK